MKWILEAIKMIIAWFSVEGKKSNNVVTDLTRFLGDKAVDLGGVTGALAGLGVEFGGAAVNEAIDFAKEHHHTLFSMTKNEMSFLWGKIFNSAGEFDEDAYKEMLKTLEDEALVALIEANAEEARNIRLRVDAKKAMAEDLKHKLAVLARFALAKAISIASHGVL
jgi:hypothetical protein